MSDGKSSPETTGNDSDINELQNELLKSNPELSDNENESEDSLDDTLSELQKEYESDDIVGAKLQNKQLAKLVDKMFRHRMPDKALKDKIDRQERPENCQNVKPTRVNQGIWGKLGEPSKKRDLQLYKIQQALVKGIIPVARMTDLSMTGRVDKEQLHDMKINGLEALSLLTHVNYEINMQRKQLMKADIGKDYATLCSPQVPFSDLLFGDDLQKQLKDIGDENKIGAKLQTKGQQNDNSGGSYKYSHKGSKNFRGQGYRPWKRKESQKSSKPSQQQSK